MQEIYLTITIMSVPTSQNKIFYDTANNSKNNNSSIIGTLNSLYIAPMEESWFYERSFVDV